MGGLALSQRMTSFKGPADVALTDSESRKVTLFDSTSNLIAKRHLRASVVFKPPYFFLYCGKTDRT